MSGLLDLPAELIVSIVSYLDDPSDVFAVRLANKHLESSSLSYFGKRFFRKKGYLITTPSINVLRSVADHVELRKHVQHVWFNPDCYTFVEPACAPEEDFDNLDDDGEPSERIDLLSQEDQRKYAAYRECVKDHAQLLSKPKLAEELTAAFTNLPNLAVVGMRRSEDHQPWGWSKLKKAVGEDPRVLGHVPSGPMYTLSGPTKLFMAMISSVAAADVKLQRFYTDAIEIDNILATNLSQERLDVACRGLLYLEVNASKAWVNKHPKAIYTTCMNEEEYGEGLLRLMTAVPQLRELGLQIFPDVRRGRGLQVSAQDYRSKYPYIAFQKIVQNVSLHHLTRLKLEKIVTSAAIFKAFMEPSQASLTSLKLRDMRLISDSKNRRPWQTIFEFLRDNCNKLSYLLFYHLKYEAGGVSFVDEPPTPDANNSHAAEGGFMFFTNYDHIAIEARGRAEVERKIADLGEKHWYQKPLFSYVMDEGLWHTDTSDEEW